MKNPTHSIAQIPRNSLVGIAQILLQPSALTGGIFLAGTFINSPILAFFGLIACLSSTLFATILKCPKQERIDGLYGINGGLIGLGLGYFYGTHLSILALAVISAMASSIIMSRMLRWKLLPFTFPFIITTWIIMLIMSATGWISPVNKFSPIPTNIDLLASIARSYGQVLFQEHVLTGIIFMVVIMIRDWVQGVFATLAIITGLIFAYTMAFPLDAVNLGLYGYNGVLCGILFAGRSSKDLFKALIAILLSIVVVRLFHVLGIPALTFPFVISSWMVLWGGSICKAQLTG